MIDRETIRGIAVASIFKYVDSVVESFVSCSSLILASFVVSFFLDKEVPYPIRRRRRNLNTTMSFYLAVGTLFIATYLYESAPEAPVILDKNSLSLKGVDRNVMGMEKLEEEIAVNQELDASVSNPSELLSVC